MRTGTVRRWQVATIWRMVARGARGVAMAPAHFDGDHAREDERSGNKDDGEGQVAVVDNDVGGEGHGGDEQDRAEERNNVAHAAVGPDRPVDAEDGVGEDEAKGDDRDDLK